MAIQQVSAVVDDLDGTPFAFPGTIEAEPIRFPVSDGEWRSVHLSPANREKFYAALRETLAPFVEVSHVVEIAGGTVGDDAYAAIEAPTVEQAEPVQVGEVAINDPSEKPAVEAQPAVEPGAAAKIGSYDPDVNYEALTTADERKIARAWGQRYGRRKNLPIPADRGRVPQPVLHAWIVAGRPVKA